jgi:uncharacterized membrane protein (UPF0127 family)
MYRRAALVLALVLMLASCSSDRPRAGNAPDNETPIVLGSPTVPGSPEFGVGTILIDGADRGPILLKGEVADTDETRQFGLMGRTEIPEDYGMVFIEFEPRDCCFYMEDTLVPLSIAFFDGEGEIVDIKDMDPCKKEPCELFSSREPYSGALEVKQGLFDEWGVSIGDRIRVVQ